MGEAFITRRGGGRKAFAYIHALYPAGSTCTCSDGEKTLTAETSTGSWTFEVPYAGTWTVKAVSGSMEKSQSVTISQQYQTAQASLTFSTMLLEGTDQHEEVTGGWAGVASSFTYAEELIAVGVSYNEEGAGLWLDGVSSHYRGGGFVTGSKIDLTDATTLKFTGIGNGAIGIVSNYSSGSSCIAAAQAGLEGGALDVSAISGSFYIMVSMTAGTSGRAYCTVNNIYLE